MKKGLNNVLKLLLAVLIVPMIVLTYMYFKQNQIIFAATQLPSEYEFSFNIPFEEVTLKTEDGALLNGIHFKTENPKGVLFYLHGNAGDLSRWGTIAGEYTKFQYDVLVIDYRTYGKSTGTINEEKMLNDMQLWYNYLLKLYSENEIIIYGRSIGTGFATYIASMNSPKKVILETPFYNLEDLVKRKFTYIPFLSSLIKIKLRSNQYIKKISCPIVIYHGTKDRVVPYKSGKLLSEQVVSNQITFVTILNGGHNNLGTFNEYWESLASILK